MVTAGSLIFGKCLQATPRQHQNETGKQANWPVWRTHGAVVATWPMASAIMTALYPDEATVLDFRAVEMLDDDRKVSRYETIVGFTSYCQRVSNKAKRYRVSLRDMDRALWQLPKERGMKSN